MVIPVTHSLEQAKALVGNGASLDDFLDWQRAVEASGATFRVTAGGCISVPIGRRFGLTIFEAEHVKYKAMTPQIDDFIASNPHQYHAPRTGDDGRKIGAVVVRLSKAKNDQPVVYSNEDAEEWKRLNGEGPLPLAKCRTPGQAVVVRGEVTAATQAAAQAPPAEGDDLEAELAGE